MSKFYNLEKLDRAKKLAGFGASEEAVLAAYLKLGGKYDADKVPAPAKIVAPKKKVK